MRHSGDPRTHVRTVRDKPPAPLPDLDALAAGSELLQRAVAVYEVVRRRHQRFLHCTGPCGGHTWHRKFTHVRQLDQTVWWICETCGHGRIDIR